MKEERLVRVWTERRLSSYSSSRLGEKMKGGAIWECVRLGNFVVCCDLCGAWQMDFKRGRCKRREMKFWNWMGLGFGPSIMGFSL